MEQYDVVKEIIEMLKEIEELAESNEKKERIHNLRQELESIFTSCESCGIMVEKEDNFCHGCKHVVCINCSEEGDHTYNGQHSINFISTLDK
jgi:hypothetical protein